MIGKKMHHSIFIGDSDFLPLYKINLINYADTLVHHVTEISDAFSMIDMTDLVIIDGNSKQQDLTSKFLKKCAGHPRNLSFIFIGKNRSYTKPSHYIADRLDIVKLIRSCAEIVGISAKNMASLDIGQFTSFPISYFKSVQDVSVPMFYKNEQGYFEEIPPSIENTFDQIAKNMSAEGYKELYSMSSERLKCSNDISKYMVETLKSQSLTLEERIKIGGHSYQIFHETLKKYGIKKESIETAEVITSSLLSTSKNKKTEIDKLIVKIKEESNSYHYANAQLITIFALNALNKMPWRTTDHQQKIASAAFFHDIILPDNLTGIISDNNFTEEFHKREEIEMVNKHAFEAAQILVQAPRIPVGTDVIVRQHHGTKNGIGFNTKGDNALSPLSIIFIISEFFSYHILSGKDDEYQLVDLIALAKMRFTSSKFLKILEAF